MKKTYISPILSIDEIAQEQMIAASIGYTDTEVNPSDALGKDEVDVWWNDDALNIWD